MHPLHDTSPSYPSPHKRAMPPDPLSPLQSDYNALIQTHLPRLARSNHPTQTHWPVSQNHCFARIILDNAVGVTKPWHHAVKAPALHNMTAPQLRDATALGRAIADGSRDLAELDSASLAMRGRSKAGGAKRKRAADHDASPSSIEPDPPKPKRAAATASPTAKAHAAADRSRYTALPTTAPVPTPADGRGAGAGAPDPLATTRRSIRAHPALTPYRRTILLLLTQVPRGRYTTYKALSEAAARLSPSCTTSNPRAVGSAMRNNPFAPAAPCHRVLAADGRIGGFKGEWGAEDGGEGAFVREKRRLLREEGVRFDGRGRVVGGAFGGFVGV